MKNTLPKGAKLKGNNHLAEGEATGHFHAATAQDARVYEHGEYEGGILLHAPSGTPVDHQEHKTVLVPGDRIHPDQIPGQWDKHGVQEFDHFTEEAREVLD
ncbi:MAG: hypothetical protein ABJB61_13055 [bacterium]